MDRGFGFRQFEDVGLVVEELVDAGMTNCFCREPDCELGMAIRQEISRRGGKPGMSQPDIKREVRSALADFGPEFELKVAKAVAVGVSAALKRERGKSLFGLIDHVLGMVVFNLGSLAIWALSGVLLVLLAPIVFVRAAIQWKVGRSYIELLKEAQEVVKEQPEAKELLEILMKLPGGQPTFITRNGWRFGAWVAKRPESIRTRLVGLTARFRREKA